MLHTSERDVHTFICRNKRLEKNLLQNERLFLLRNGNLHGLGTCGFGVVVVGVHGVPGGGGLIITVGDHIGG
jgi:hypothetical protein